MKVVSIGDLVTDYYYKDGKLLGLNGGMTSHNIIANLSHLGIDTSVIGVVGDDKPGMIAIKSLEDIGVDISNVKIIENVKTRCFHINYEQAEESVKIISKKRCPICNSKKWYNDSLINFDHVLVDKSDILVFDNLNIVNQKIIDKLDNKKVIDLGQYYEFESLTLDEIVNKLRDNFQIINFNERVSKYLIKRFNFKSEDELYNLTNTSLITITKGKKGATFIYNGKVFNFSLDKIIDEVDSTGAGDAFISSIIKDWISNNLEFNEEMLPLWYKNATKLTSKVIKKMGARGHINKLYKIKMNKHECTCQNFELTNRREVKRCNININNLKTRVINAINSDAPNNISNVNFSKNENYLFVGTGGSFAPAVFCSKLVNYFLGCNAYPIYPRDVLYRNNSSIDKMILFSYSGTTNDLIEGTKKFSSNNKFVITKGEITKIVSKTNILHENIILYRTNSNKGRERGFLSFEGSIVPSAIFLNIFIKI